MKVGWRPFEHTYQAFKRKRPPSVNRPKEVKVFSEMKGHMMVWTEIVSREELLYQLQI